MRFILKNKTLYVSTTLIGADNENNSEEIIIDISNYPELAEKYAFLEFKVSDNRKYTTSELPIVDNIIRYLLPNGLMKFGYLQMQLIFRDEDYVWKSYITSMIVKESINAGEDIPEEYPDFVSDTVRRLNILEENDIIQNEALEYLNESTVKKRLSVLPEATGRMNALLYVDDDGVSSKISIDDLGKKIIKTGGSSEEKGQYTFVEIGGN